MEVKSEERYTSFLAGFGDKGFMIACFNQLVPVFSTFATILESLESIVDEYMNEEASPPALPSPEVGAPVRLSGVNARRSSVVRVVGDRAQSFGDGELEHGAGFVYADDSLAEGVGA